MSLNLSALLGKLDDTLRQTLGNASGLAISRTHYDVEVEHYLIKALDDTAGDIAVILKHYGIDRSRLASELTRSLDRLKTGNARNPSFSPTLVKMFTEAWTLGSLEFNATKVRTGHLLLALRSVDELARLTQGVSKELEKIPAEGLKKEFASIVAGLNEIPGIRCATPLGAFYAFPSIAGTGLSGAELAERLMHEADVCVLAGTAFGGVGTEHIRVSYANSRENLTEALGRIGRFVEGLGRG